MSFDSIPSVERQSIPVNQNNRTKQTPASLWQHLPVVFKSKGSRLSRQIAAGNPCNSGGAPNSRLEKHCGKGVDALKAEKGFADLRAAISRQGRSIFRRAHFRRGRRQNAHFDLKLSGIQRTLLPNAKDGLGYFYSRVGVIGWMCQRETAACCRTAVGLGRGLRRKGADHI